MALTPAQANALRDMVVVVDSRETKPYGFANTGVLHTTAVLKTGDYSVRGLEDHVVVERKEFGDFLSCCAGARTRFQAEVLRMVKIPHSLLVIETDYTNIALGMHPKHRKLKPRTAISTLATIMARGIMVIPAGDRKKAEALTLGYLQRVFLMTRGLKR